MSETHQITTPVGRLVSGDVFQGSDKDPATGRQRTTRAGQPRTVFFIGVALPKSDPATQQCLDTIRAAAAEFRNNETARADFSWKITDGDSTVPNQRGRKPCDQEGFAGHWVLKFSTSFPPRVYTTQNQEIVDPRAIKRGDYLRVAGTVRANGDAQKPGVYLSQSLVQFVRPGEEIRVGLDPVTAFGGAPPPASGFGGAPRPVPGFGVPPTPAPPPPPPAAPAGRTMSHGCPYTYEQLRAQGWSDAQMLAAGHLADDDIPY